MSDDNKDSRTGGSSSISDEIIRRCLLGAASPTEQTTFEELLLLDDEIEKRVRLAELELADDFSFDRLSAAERELFTDNFLVTSERRRKLAGSHALRASLSRRMAETEAAKPIHLEVEMSRMPPPHETKPGSALRRLLKPGPIRYLHPAVSLGLGITALVLIFGLLWIITKRPRMRVPEVARRQTTASPGREYAHPVSSQPPAPSTTDPRTATSSEANPVGTLVLQPGRQFDDQQVQFTAPPTDTDIVRLELMLGSHQTASYKAELLTAAGERVAVASEPKMVVEVEQAKLVWDISAQQLKPGNYRVELKTVAEHQEHDAGLYRFRVK